MMVAKWPLSLEQLTCIIIQAGASRLDGRFQGVEVCAAADAGETAVAAADYGGGGESGLLCIFPLASCFLSSPPLV